VGLMGWVMLVLHIEAIEVAECCRMQLLFPRELLRCEAPWGPQLGCIIHGPVFKGGGLFLLVGPHVR
jgi:hypothetical protein